MALHRKVDALLELRPDIAIISECATPDLLIEKSTSDWIETPPTWIGKNHHKGLGVFGFNGYRLELNDRYSPHLHYVAPVHITGPTYFNLLAVWAQNVSGGNTRKRQSGPLRRGLNRYRDFLTDQPSIIAGDMNNNAIWDRPGWCINHMTKVRILEEMDRVSAYHAWTGERQGEESIPTHYWRDRRKDGPTYHIDYIFAPRHWLPHVTEFIVGTFEDWCGNGLSDHVPLVMDVQI